jgi:hypothetical protein
MDHRVAEQRNAVERYLLGEYADEERREFEEHLFECAICGEQVRESAIVIDNLKEVLREEAPPISERKRGRDWMDWFRLPMLVPSLAALMLAAVVGYQNWVYIPRLEQPEVLSTFTIAPQARDEAPVITTDRRLPRFNLNFLVDAPETYSSYICDFRNENDASVIRVPSGPEKLASFTLGIALPTKDFPPGRYIMVLRPISSPQTEVQRYPFVIQHGEHK